MYYSYTLVVCFQGFLYWHMHKLLCYDNLAYRFVCYPPFWWHGIVFPLKRSYSVPRCVKNLYVWQEKNTQSWSMVNEECFPFLNFTKNDYKMSMDFASQWEDTNEIFYMCILWNSKKAMLVASLGPWASS